jgi:mitochondrial chaperone BCS1
LSFALAGVFGLDIYCLALSESTLTEEDLILLFNSLPRRCILLLEDIDTAGLLRTPRVSQPKKAILTINGHDAESHRTIDPGTDANEVAANDMLQATVAASKESSHKNNLTLSGLLNAIDGVACQEGRILIMVSRLIPTVRTA